MRRNYNIRKIDNPKSRLPVKWRDRWKNRCVSLDVRVYRCVCHRLSLRYECEIVMWNRPSEILRPAPDKCKAAATETRPTNTNPIDPRNTHQTVHHLKLQIKNREREKKVSVSWFNQKVETIKLHFQMVRSIVFIQFLVMQKKKKTKVGY